MKSFSPMKPHALNGYFRVSKKFCNILVVRLHGFFYNNMVSQKFCNILVVREPQLACSGCFC